MGMEIAKELNEPFLFSFSHKEKGDSSIGGIEKPRHGPSIGERLHNLKTQPNDGVAIDAAPPERELINGR